MRIVDATLTVIIVFLSLLGTFGSFYLIDKPRKPLTTTVALVSLVVNSVVIYLLWKAYIING